MGEIADDILEGIFCQHCGAYIHGKAPGYPRSCKDCKESEKPAAPKKRKHKRSKR